MQEFDPNAPASEGAGIYGLPHGPDDAAVHVLPVPFDATASYGKGAALGPAAVLRASAQVDLLDLLTGSPWKHGIWMAPIDDTIVAWNRAAAAAVERHDAAAVDGIMAELNAWVEERTEAALAAGKLVAVLGGDHSVPYGAIRAHAARSPGLGVLHVDAHADLRAAYEGYTWSHASILHNVVERLDGVAQVVQVGVRDLCDEELAAIHASQGRVRTIFDHELAEARFGGQDLVTVVRRSLEPLPEEVYVTFDVDGLDPTLCPGTGTPVPGGLSWHEAMLWLGELARSGRRIVGLDLNEVAPSPVADPERDSWDAVIGARLLYRMIGFALVSRAERR
jgi:agmatinase